jgi:hypothetical protein
VLAEGLLVHRQAHGGWVASAFVARLQYLCDLVGAEALLGCAGLHLLAPGVSLHAVLLALARRERRVLRRALGIQADPALRRRAPHLLAAL